MTVRPAGVGDWDSMTAVFVAAGRAAWQHILGSEALERLMPPARWRPGAGSDALVAVHEGNVVGFVVLRRSGDADAPDTVGEVDALYVHPSHWHLGIGRSLLGAGVASLAASGFREATLWTEARNHRPRRIYEMSGWHLDGTRRTRTHLAVELVEDRFRCDLPT